MRTTLKVLSALLSYPTAELQAAMPELKEAVAGDAALPEHSRHRLARIMDEIAGSDIIDCQERYVLLFDRTRSLSLHLFEHVHNESRDRGQAMVDLKSLYERHGLDMGAGELPDYLPLFLEFASEIPEPEARDLVAEVSHILEAIRQRLKVRKSAYSSVFSACQLLAGVSPQEAATRCDTTGIVDQDDDPNDLAALDDAWADEEVRFGPSASACGSDALVTKLRAGSRRAPGMPAPEPKRPVITHSPSRQA